MKQAKKYIIVFIIFLILMIFVLLFFMYKYNRNSIISQSNELLNDLNALKEGKYNYKNGFIYSEENSLISSKHYLSGDGKIQIDKYGNIRFYIQNPDVCVSKNYIGSFDLSKKCEDFKDIKVNISRNNSTISFSSNTKNLSFKISKNDDFKGTWNKTTYEKNIVLKYYNQGDNYIWFSDVNGNLSEPIKFHVDCLNTTNANYDKSIFYCSGSTIIIDGSNWVVLEDNSNTIKLLMKEPISDKLSLCLNDNKGFCYKTGEEVEYYRWSNSFVNNYLNNIFIETLSDNIKDSLVEMDICDDYDNFNCDDSICGGYTKDEILEKEWSCSKYTQSKVKLISYLEFNYAYVNSKNRTNLRGNYLAINSYVHNFASSVNNFDFYILEDIHNKMDIRPVIQLSK